MITIKRVTALLLTLALILGDAPLWAYPFTDKGTKTDTIQVQTMFAPLRDKDIEVTAIMEAEILFAARLALQKGRTLESINRAMNRWRWSLKDAGQIRAIESIKLLGAERQEGENKAVITFSVNDREGQPRVFQLTYLDNSGFSGLNKYATRYADMGNRTVSVDDAVTIEEIEPAATTRARASAVRESSTGVISDRTRAVVGGALLLQAAIGMATLTGCAGTNQIEEPTEIVKPVIEGKVAAIYGERRIEFTKVNEEGVYELKLINLRYDSSYTWTFDVNSGMIADNYSKEYYPDVGNPRNYQAQFIQVIEWLIYPYSTYEEGDRDTLVAVARQLARVGMSPAPAANYSVIAANDSRILELTDTPDGYVIRIRETLPYDDSYTYTFDKDSGALTFDRSGGWSIHPDGRYFVITGQGYATEKPRPEGMTYDEKVAEVMELLAPISSPSYDVFARGTEITLAVAAHDIADIASEKSAESRDSSSGRKRAWTQDMVLDVIKQADAEGLGLRHVMIQLDHQRSTPAGRELYTAYWAVMHKRVEGISSWTEALAKAEITLVDRAKSQAGDKQEPADDAYVSKRRNRIRREVLDSAKSAYAWKEFRRKTLRSYYGGDQKALIFDAANSFYTHTQLDTRELPEYILGRIVASADHRMLSRIIRPMRGKGDSGNAHIRRVYYTVIFAMEEALRDWKGPLDVESLTRAVNENERIKYYRIFMTPQDTRRFLALKEQGAIVHKIRFLYSAAGGVSPGDLLDIDRASAVRESSSGNVPSEAADRLRRMFTDLEAAKPAPMLMAVTFLRPFEEESSWLSQAARFRNADGGVNAILMKRLDGDAARREIKASLTNLRLWVSKYVAKTSGPDGQISIEDFGGRMARVIEDMETLLTNGLPERNTHFAGLKAPRSGEDAPNLSELAVSLRDAGLTRDRWESLCMNFTWLYYRPVYDKTYIDTCFGQFGQSLTDGDPFKEEDNLNNLKLALLAVYYRPDGLWHEDVESATPISQFVADHLAAGEARFSSSGVTKENKPRLISGSELKTLLPDIASVRPKEGQAKAIRLYTDGYSHEPYTSWLAREMNGREDKIKDGNAVFKFIEDDGLYFFVVKNGLAEAAPLPVADLNPALQSGVMSVFANKDVRERKPTVTVNTEDSAIIQLTPGCGFELTRVKGKFPETEPTTYAIRSVYADGAVSTADFTYYASQFAELTVPNFVAKEVRQTDLGMREPQSYIKGGGSVTKRESSSGKYAEGADVVGTAKANAEEFMRSLFGKLAARNPAGEKERVLLWLDTSWMPEMTRGQVQDLINSIRDIAGKEGVDNLVVESRNNGEYKASDIAVMARESNVPLANVVVLAAKDICMHEDEPKPEFVRLTEAGAFLAVVDPERLNDINGFCDPKLVEMLTVAVKNAFGESIAESPDMAIDFLSDRIVKLLPYPHKVDVDILLEKARIQKEYIDSAA